MGKVLRALVKAGDSATLGDDEIMANEQGARLRSPWEALSGGKKRHRAKVGHVERWDERLVVAAMNSGAAAENFRVLRSHILHLFQGISPRTLLITSATPNEGKSFVCANLGISMVQSVGQHGLLVDCDLRTPSLHRLFGVANELGLTDYLQATRELREVIGTSGMEKLSIIPAGAPPVNPAELLSTEAMKLFLTEVANRYDDRVILLDSPPFQTAAETAVLAQYVDGVILVVRWGGGRREYVRELVELIGRDKIVSVVFNAYEDNFLHTRIFGSYGYYSEKGYS